MLDFEGFPCNDEHTYHLSDCILDDFEKKSMQKVGCTTPFGKIKDNICKDDYKGIYHRLLTSFNMPISYLLYYRSRNVLSKHVNNKFLFERA